MQNKYYCKKQNECNIPNIIEPIKTAVQQENVTLITIFDIINID